MQARNWETICTPGDGVKKGIFRCLRGEAYANFSGSRNLSEELLKKWALQHSFFPHSKFYWYNTLPRGTLPSRWSKYNRHKNSQVEGLILPNRRSILPPPSATAILQLAHR